MHDPSIITKDLSKQYPGSDKPALDNLSVSVKSGEVYGFLGPNGAGKSTAIRLLMNLIQPTKGQGTILGYDIITDSLAVRQSVGYLSGDFAVYPKMTGQQFLNFMNELQPAVSQQYVAELGKRLRANLNQRFSDLSRGNKQKIGIIQALMHQPKVLILDEPTSGLDPLMQEEFYELMSEAKQRGSCVFVSSHILSEVQKMCDRVGIIRDGRLIAERNITDMATEAAQTFDIAFNGKIPLSELKKLKGVILQKQEGKSITLHVNGKLAPLLTLLGRYDVIKMDARNLDLEEAFLRFYEDEEPKS